jgi:hypothetical protein
MQAISVPFFVPASHQLMGNSACLITEADRGGLVESYQLANIHELVVYKLVVLDLRERGGTIIKFQCVLYRAGNPHRKFVFLRPRETIYINFWLIP